MRPSTASGLENLNLVLGSSLRGITRYVLGLGQANDEFGHGITDLVFDHVSMAILPGRNEDWIEIRIGPTDPAALLQDHWRRVDVDRMPAWTRRHRGGTLIGIDIYSDGHEDVALGFRFDTDDQFYVALCDTDLRLVDDLSAFAGAGEPTPTLRTQLE